MKRILTTLLACSFVFGGFGVLTGCSNQETEEESSEILLYDFEDYDRNFALMHALSFFGRVDVNEDSGYAKSGTGSALLRPLGHQSTTAIYATIRNYADDCLFIPFSSVKYDFDYTDLTKTESVRFSMYNAEEKNLNVYVGFAFSQLGDAASLPVRYTLKPGWNDVICMVDHATISLMYNLKQCFGFTIGFDNVGSRYVKDAPTVYLDDISIKRTATEIKYDNLISLDGDVVLGFEQLWELYTVTSIVEGERFPLDIVRALDYGLVAPEGEKVLKFSQAADAYNDGSTRKYFVITESILQAANLTSYDENDMLCFDIYNDTDEFLPIAVCFQVESQQNGYKYVPLSVKPKEWSTFKMSLGGIDHLFGKENGFRSEPFRILLSFEQYIGEIGTARDMFFDNFRVERNA